MNLNQENDPERARSSRDERTHEMGRGDEEMRSPEESDLGRAQAEGNLGNERPRQRRKEEESARSTSHVARST